MYVFSLASVRYNFPVFFVQPRLCSDQILDKFWKGWLRVSLLPFSSSCHADDPPLLVDDALLSPGVAPDLVPEGGGDPGEGMAGDEEGGCILELPDVGQPASPGPEHLVKLTAIISCVLQVGQQSYGKRGGGNFRN